MTILVSRSLGKAAAGIILLAWCTTAAGQVTDSKETLNVSPIPRVLTLRNAPEIAEVSNGDTLRLASKKGTNLFISPGGNYTVLDAPMALFEPDDDFILTAKVSAVLKDVYDVAALVLYQDDNQWAKLCFENSALKEPTIVSVVTRDYSDDGNSETVSTPDVFLAVARKGPELSFHFSADGKTWRLVRHFRMAFSDDVRIGFAVHSSHRDDFEASFSDITYSASSPANMRQLEASESGRH